MYIYIYTYITYVSWQSVGCEGIKSEMTQNERIQGLHYVDCLLIILYTNLESHN